MVYALFVGGLERNRAVSGGNLTPIDLTIADGSYWLTPVGCTGRRELTPGARADVAKINCCWPDCGRWGPTTVI